MEFTENARPLLTTARISGPTSSHIADLSVDGATPMPMVCLLTATGTVVIPTAEDDPAIDDGTDHVVRIAVHPTRPGNRDDLPPLPQDCWLWQPGFDTSVIRSSDGDGELTHLIVTSILPRSVSDSAPRPRRGYPRGRPSHVATTMIALFTGFVVGWMILRAITSRGRRGRDFGTPREGTRALPSHRAALSTGSHVESKDLREPLHPDPR
ncbi:hypothetical protein [Nocardia mexicana]|uniref:Uncharacterized protein n=1 Tax=Nocardia mexicana TaxID=279262 RepID=A0A370H4Q6_9NOCA|nr:hypothetical protein [Nocardia mexicana]RDI51146.1 hypothetical protein DFR68_105624 [Nocardia mexicana]